MNFKSFYLIELTNRELVVVDVQPAYKKYISFNVEKFLNEIKEKDYSKILYLFNGPDFGFESEKDIKDWLFETVDYDDDMCEFIDTFKFYEKNYGFYRDLMDSDYDYGDIVKLIKYMSDKNINDSRDIEEDDWKKLKIDNIEPNTIYIPDVLNILKNYNNIDLCGGGRNECLKEIEICLDVIGKDYNLLSKWSY